jgi:hypothetical protein
MISYGKDIARKEDHTKPDSEDGTEYAGNISHLSLIFRSLTLILLFDRQKEHTLICPLVLFLAFHGNNDDRT